jgi:hypothetical protein
MKLGWLIWAKLDKITSGQEPRPLLTYIPRSKSGYLHHPTERRTITSTSRLLRGHAVPSAVGGRWREIDES